MTLPLDPDDPLLHMPATELLDLFATLEAPALDEMNGEYASCLLPQSHPLLDWGSKLALGGTVMPLRWLGKAFHPTSATRGRGYNMFRLLGRELRFLPMRTLVAPSPRDGRPSYLLVYQAFHSPLGYIRVVDELRSVREGVYLGIGAAGFGERQRRIPFPFLLGGPVAAYRGDVGWERKGFDRVLEAPVMAQAWHAADQVS